MLREGSADARFVRLDVTDATSAQHAAEWIEAEYARLDILVNNAGTASVTRRGATPSQTSLEDMRAVYEINVFGVVIVTNAMLHCSAALRPGESSMSPARLARSPRRAIR